MNRHGFLRGLAANCVIIGLMASVGPEIPAALGGVPESWEPSVHEKTIFLFGARIGNIMCVIPMNKAGASMFDGLRKEIAGALHDLDVSPSDAGDVLSAFDAVAEASSVSASLMEVRYDRLVKLMDCAKRVVGGNQKKDLAELIQLAWTCATCVDQGELAAMVPVAKMTQTFSLYLAGLSKQITDGSFPPAVERHIRAACVAGRLSNGTLTPEQTKIALNELKDVLKLYGAESTYSVSMGHGGDESADSASRKTDSKFAEAEHAYVSGIANYCFDDMGGAIRDFERAQQLYRQVSHTERNQAACDYEIGLAMGQMGLFENAIQYWSRALSKFLAIGDTVGAQAQCHQNTAVAFNNLNQCDYAIQHQTKALALYVGTTNSAMEVAGSYGNLGVSYAMMGQYDSATRMFAEARDRYASIEGAVREQARSTMNIGQVLIAARRFDASIEQFKKALVLYESIDGTKSDQEACWANIGDALRGVERYSEAIEAYGKVISPGWETAKGAGLAYRGRGGPGDIEAAASWLLLSTKRAEQTRARVVAADYRASAFERPSTVFGELAALLVDRATASVNLQAPDIVRWAQGAPMESAMSCAAFHFADQGKGRNLEEAVRERNALREARPERQLLAEDQDLSRRISKLSALREALPPSQTEEKKKWGEDLDRLQQRRNMIEGELKRTALVRYAAPEFRPPMEMATELETDRAVLQYSTGAEHSWLLLMTREGVTAHKLGLPVRALPELFVGQEAAVAKLVEMWKTRPEQIGLDGLVRLARERAEDQGRRQMERHNLVDALQERIILERLGSVVLPVSALTELRDKRISRLLVIPDGSLHYVPFSMLRVPKPEGVSAQYLIEEFAISYTPAMTTLETIRKQKAERTKRRVVPRRDLLAFANPAFGTESVQASDDFTTRLRSFQHDYYTKGGLNQVSLLETEPEALRIASLFAPPQIVRNPSTNWPDGVSVVCLNKAASEEQAKRWLGCGEGAAGKPWRNVVFSTHGLADTQNGMLSCLALSTPMKDSKEDGYLQAQEVMNLELDTDLVMLSACQTGLGRLRSGEGLVGLSAAFFVAGAESVCATLWQVPSGPASQLGPEFFRRLEESKLDRSEALRQAQLHVLRQGQDPDGKTKDYSDPFCWAAFVLYGEYLITQPATPALGTRKTVTVPPSYGASLFEAAEMGDLQGLSSELAKAADINAKNENGQTLLIIAAQEGHTSIIKLLLEKRADVKEVGTGGSALVCAAMKGQTKAVTLLAENGADVNEIDSAGMTPLMWATVFTPDPSVIDALIKRGAVVNAKNAEGNTALACAATQCNNLGVIHALVNGGADVNVKLDSTRVAELTPLMIACSANRDAAVVGEFIKAGADVNTKSSVGMTPLMYAAALNSHPAVVTTLVKAGAKVDARDSNGRTAYDYALAKGNEQARAELTKAESKQ